MESLVGYLHLVFGLLLDEVDCGVFREIGRWCQQSGLGWLLYRSGAICVFWCRLVVLPPAVYADH